jgi:NADPH:quinone reductase-like Zn-dependent oxidoreductase
MPETMRAILLSRHDADVRQAITGLQVVQRPRPIPASGQVLVRIAAAPCNPSDLLFLQNRYGGFKTLPSVPGWEGAGTVVGSGGGWVARWLVGKRVACTLQSDRDGTWAEYFVANALECLPLSSQLSVEQGASLIINPMTAMALLQDARRGGHRAAVHTAGASQLGRMLLAIANQMRYPMIHIVRRAAQVQLLKSLGATHVLDSSDQSFAQELERLAAQLGATIAFEAVAGDMTGKVLAAMPAGATVVLYGSLSDGECGPLNPVDVIFQHKTLTGFYLGNWIRRRNLLSVLRLANQVQQMMVNKIIHSEVQRNVHFDNVVEGLLHYVDHMTDGKVLIRP